MTRPGRAGLSISALGLMAISACSSADTGSQTAAAGSSAATTTAGVGGAGGAAGGDGGDGGSSWTTVTGAGGAGGGFGQGGGSVIDTTSHVLVISDMSIFPVEAQGISFGFNLDGIVSTGADPESCQTKDFVSATGAPGIDNQFGAAVTAMKQYYPKNPDYGLNGALSGGQIIAIIDLEGLGPDPSNDDCVDVAIQQGKGEMSIGADGEVEHNQTFELEPGAPRGEIACAKSSAGVMNAGPFELTLPTNLFEVTFMLPIHAATVQLTVAADGEYVGVLAGSIDIDDLLAKVKNQVSVAAVLPQLTATLHDFGDMGKAADGTCKQMSLTLNFLAVPAFLAPGAASP